MIFITLHDSDMEGKLQTFSNRTFSYACQQHQISICITNVLQSIDFQAIPIERKSSGQTAAAQTYEPNAD